MVSGAGIDATSGRCKHKATRATMFHAAGRVPATNTFTLLTGAQSAMAMEEAPHGVQRSEVG
jgi:hypothetical protein